MNDKDSHETRPADDPPAASREDHAETQADHAAGRLREQIADLRRQVKDAQATLREHHRRHEGRSFKR